jgi:pimeloyl-ACP methyl ester carboxylesterase
MRWIRRALLWSLVALLVALAVGAIYQAIATEIDQRAAFPGPGEMVDVGERRLHMNCVGQGSPTVVLDAGLGYTSVEWSGWVQPEVAKRTRVCAYDRAGMGWSEPEPGPPNFTTLRMSSTPCCRRQMKKAPTSWSATPSPASTLASTPIVTPRK